MCLINTFFLTAYQFVFFLVLVIGFGQWQWVPFYICTLICLLPFTSATSNPQATSMKIHKSFNNHPFTAMKCNTQNFSMVSPRNYIRSASATNFSMYEIPKIHFSVSKVSESLMFTSFELLQISILSSFGVHLFMKHKYFLLIQVFIHQLHFVKSESALPSFIYKSKELTTPEPSDFDLLLSNFSWNHASVLISSFVICILLVLTFYYFYNKQKHRYTKIVLELTNGHECILIPVLNLPLCPSFWKICPPSNIHEINVHVHPFTSKMRIHWTDFNVTNISGTRTINVKSTIPLNFFAALQAKRITQQPFDIQVFITHHGLYQSLPHYGTFIVDALTTKEHLP